MEKEIEMTVMSEPGEGCVRRESRGATGGAEEV